jgi:hypothetical protein
MSTEWLEDPQNRQFVREVSLAVIDAVATSEEAPFAAIFVDPVLDAVASGEMSDASASDAAGGFGDPELMTVLAVPLVVDLISLLLVKAGERSVTRLKTRWNNPDEQLLEIRLLLNKETADLIARQPRTPEARRKMEELLTVIQSALLHHLEQP